MKSIWRAGIVINVAGSAVPSGIGKNTGGGPRTIGTAPPVLIFVKVSDTESESPPAWANTNLGATASAASKASTTQCLCLIFISYPSIEMVRLFRRLTAPTAAAHCQSPSSSQPVNGPMRFLFESLNGQCQE